MRKEDGAAVSLTLPLIAVQKKSMFLAMRINDWFWEYSLA